MTALVQPRAVDRRNVVKRFAPNAVEGIDVAVAHGEILRLLRPNGAWEDDHLLLTAFVARDLGVAIGTVASPTQIGLIVCPVGVPETC